MTSLKIIILGGGHYLWVGGGGVFRGGGENLSAQTSGGDKI